MTENGYNEEEMKMVKETHKIWGQEEVNITATCIRVPIMRAHAESINLEFSRDISENEVSLLIFSRSDRAKCPPCGCLNPIGWSCTSCSLQLFYITKDLIIYP